MSDIPQWIEVAEGLATDRDYLRNRVAELEQQMGALLDLLEEAVAKHATGPLVRYGQPACSCGHPWGIHDVAEYPEDGTETCCVHGCSQEGCPGRNNSDLSTAEFLGLQPDGFMMLEVEDPSLEAKPGLRSRIKRVRDEIRIFTGDDPDRSGVQIEMDTFEEAARTAARMVPECNVAVRRRYVSDWVIAG